MHHHRVKQYQCAAALTQSLHPKKLHFGKGVDSVFVKLSNSMWQIQNKDIRRCWSAFRQQSCRIPHKSQEQQNNFHHLDKVCVLYLPKFVIWTKLEGKVPTYKLFVKSIFSVRVRRQQELRSEWWDRKSHITICISSS